MGGTCSLEARALSPSEPRKRPSPCKRSKAWTASGSTLPPAFRTAQPAFRPGRLSGRLILQPAFRPADPTAGFPPLSSPPPAFRPRPPFGGEESAGERGDAGPARQRAGGEGGRQRGSRCGSGAPGRARGAGAARGVGRRFRARNRRPFARGSRIASWFGGYSVASSRRRNAKCENTTFKNTEIVRK